MTRQKAVGEEGRKKKRPVGGSGGLLIPSPKTAHSCWLSVWALDRKGDTSSSGIVPCSSSIQQLVHLFPDQNTRYTVNFGKGPALVWKFLCLPLRQKEMY